MKKLSLSLTFAFSLGACERAVDFNLSRNEAGTSNTPAVESTASTPANNADSAASDSANISTNATTNTASNTSSPPKVICGGLGSKASTAGNGLVANLYYAANETQGKSFSTSADYIRDGIASDATLLMGDLNMPTQIFSAGFRYGSGPNDFVRANDGTKLFEWFAIDARSHFQLTDSQAEGSYQFALLSDDGSTAYLDGQVIVPNENAHATRMACGSHSVNLMHGVSHNLEVTYFQGPRYHIALMLLWRPTPSGASSDPYCGKTQNYFDPNTSTALQPYQDLQARGWQPVPSANFILPDEASDADTACHS